MLSKLENPIIRRPKIKYHPSLIACIGIIICTLVTNDLSFAESSKLIIRVKKTGECISTIKLDSNEYFEIQTIHSVTRRPYSHVFKVEKDKIILDQAIYDSAGGGYPVLGDGKFVMIDGKFIMKEMNRNIGILRFRTSPISKETFKAPNYILTLYDKFPEGTLIEIEALKSDN